MLDPSELVYCEDAHITVHASAPVYGVDNISSGVLADLLGLQDGDRFVSINGVDLDSKDDLITAAVALWIAGETDYDLVTSRSRTSPFTLYYELIP
ncbi:hypothetical protein [Enhygromyxa salina]|uniref:hypothetical protein n=1 Tax=Enhygromyxa salina TaxID=215803 RepID=UPI0011BA730D|nr:hypothetical protein [Enhygromyxa salina]